MLKSIKNIIIIILIILLIVTLYSYFYLSNKMINFEAERLNYISIKEIEFKDIDRKLTYNKTCANELEKCKQSVEKINSVIDELTGKTKKSAQKSENLIDKSYCECLLKIKEPVQQKLQSEAEVKLQSEAEIKLQSENEAKVILQPETEVETILQPESPSNLQQQNMSTAPNINDIIQNANLQQQNIGTTPNINDIIRNADSSLPNLTQSNPQQVSSSILRLFN